MMIVHLLCTFLFAIGAVICGWVMGHVGWISLAFYTAGGLSGLLLACPLIAVLRLFFSSPGEQPEDEMTEATV